MRITLLLGIGLTNAWTGARKANALSSASVYVARHVNRAVRLLQFKPLLAKTRTLGDTLNFLQAKLPSSTVHELTSLFAPSDIPADDIMELVIKIKNTDVNVREFSAYLSLIDRIYGRISRGGFKSYSLTPYRQLELTEIREDSIELTITEVPSHFQDTFPLVILWLFLKYFPTGFKVISEGTKNFADAYKSIEEGRLVRENRKKLKEEIRRDELLQKLNNQQINQIMALLADLEINERRKIPAASRFNRKYVKSVTITVRKRRE